MCFRVDKNLFGFSPGVLGPLGVASGGQPQTSSNQKFLLSKFVWYASLMKKLPVPCMLTPSVVPRELGVEAGVNELCIFNLNSWMVYTGTSLPAPKQLCALAHLGSIREAGLSSFFKSNFYN